MDIIYYKGKGEHSVNQLEGIIERQLNELYQKQITNQELLKCLMDIRKWYEENQEEYLGEYTPVCFSIALSLINKINLR